VPFDSDFASPVTAQPAPQTHTAAVATASASDHTPSTGVNPTADPTKDIDLVVVGNLDDQPFITPVTVTSAVEATADTIINSASLTVSNSQIYVIEFYSPNANQTVGVNVNDRLRFTVWRNTTDLGRACVLFPGGFPVYFRYYDFNPPAVATVYSVKGSVANSGESWSVSAGAGGAGNQTRGYLRVYQDI